MSFNSFSKTFSFNIYLLSLALFKPAVTVRFHLIKPVEFWPFIVQLSTSKKVLPILYYKIVLQI